MAGNVSLGNALTGSAGLLDGHDVMNGAASEYTESRPRGTSKGPDQPEPMLTADEIYDAWRASVESTDAAAVRYVLLVMYCAAPV